jgi:integrase
LVERQHKTGNLSNQFAYLLAAAGLREKKNHKNTGKGRGSRRDVEPLSFHSLRRTATTILHEAGVPAAVAQALIGHDSEAMHELYVSVGSEALQKAAAALPEI